MLLGKLDDAREHRVLTPHQRLPGDDRVDQILRHHRRLTQRVGALADDEDRTGRAEAQWRDQDARSLENFDHG